VVVVVVVKVAAAVVSILSTYTPIPNQAEYDFMNMIVK
jgi:hypothetical protein